MGDDLPPITTTGTTGFTTTTPSTTIAGGPPGTSTTNIPTTVKTGLEALSKRLRTTVDISQKDLEVYHEATRKLYSKSNLNENEKRFLNDYISSVASLLDKARQPTQQAPSLQPSSWSSAPALMSEANARNVIKLNELVIKPDVFDGEKPRPRRWITEYEEAALANGWTNEITIKYFPTFLKGSAKDWYFTDVRPLLIEKWTDIKIQFEANYLGESDHMQLAQSIELTRQRQGESVSNFIPRLRRLLLLLNPGLPEDEQLRQVRLKLRPEYGPLVAYANVQNLDELKSCCLRIEAGFAKKSEPKKNQNQSRTANNKGTQKINQISSTDKVCSRCDRAGHEASKCFAKKKKDGTMINSKPNAPMPERKNTKKVLQVSKPIASKSNDSNEQVTVSRAKDTLYLVVSDQKDLITTTILVNQRKVDAVVDTGAHLTVMDAKLCNELQLEPKGAKPKLIGAGGELLQVQGIVKVELKVKIGSFVKTKNHSVVVIKNLPAKFLIGLELMRCMEINIDTKNRKLSFLKSSIPKGIFAQQEETLPARSLTQLTARVNYIGKLLVQGNGRYNVANSIDESKNGTVSMVIMNPNQSDVNIRPNDQLAGFEPIDEPASLMVNNIVPLGQTDKTIQIGKKLTKDQQQDLRKLLTQHLDAFSINGELGNVIGHQHDIELETDAKPFCEPLRRRAQIQIEETRTQVQEMLKQGIIEDSNSPWASAYVLAKKKNGSWRLCIDFRRLNAMTKKVVYPLPNIDECLDTLSGKKFFSTIDFQSGFWQISLSESAKEKTAFRTEDGQFQFTRMPFGLTNAPASFQKMINGVLSGLKGLTLQVFIDDVCIATTTWAEHLEMLAKLFKAVINANLKINPSKCVIGADLVIFLGHEISADGIRQDPEKLRALLQVPAPEDPKGIKRFLGMCSYYRRFVPNFAMIAEPLTKLTRKNATFNWTDEQQSAMNQLLAELAKNATLAHFNHEDPVMLKTDASHKGVAGILLQEQKGEWKLVCCCSRRLTPAETNYGITDLEGLALVWTITKLRPYLLGKKFKIIVDHCALCALNHKLPASPKLRRWAIALSEFNFEIVYTKGQLHQDVDCLSRAPVNNETDPFLEHCVYSIVMPLDREEWIDDYGADETSQNLLQDALERKGQLCLKDGVIYNGDLLYVPETRRLEIIQNVHQSQLNIHPGIEGTCAKLSEHYWWPNMKQEVSEALANCLVCAKHKSVRAAPAGQMHSFAVCTPGERIAVDSFGPIRESNGKNRHIIVAIDMFTRFVELKAVPNIQKETFAAFLLEYCGRYGIPKEILSDHSKTFLNELVNGICEIFGISQIKATPYHHEGNSMAERVIQVVQEKLRMVLDDELEKDNWDTMIPLINLSINTSFHKSIGHSPYELTFGVKPPLHDKGLTKNTTPLDLHLKMIQLYLQECYNKAVAIQSLSQAKAKEHYDKSHRNITYDLQDQVMVRAPADRRNKFAPKYKGPYEIVGRKNDIYELKDQKTQKFVSRHVSDLKTIRRAANYLMPILALISMMSYISADSMSFDRVRPVVWGTSKYKVSVGTAYYDINFKFQSPCGWFRDAIVKHAPDNNNYIVGNALQNWEKMCNDLYTNEWLNTVRAFLNEHEGIQFKGIEPPTIPNFSVPKKYTQDELTPEELAVQKLNARQEPAVAPIENTIQEVGPRNLTVIKRPVPFITIQDQKRKKRDLIGAFTQEIGKGLGSLAGNALAHASGYFIGNIASNLITTVVDWLNPNSIPNRVDQLEKVNKKFIENYDIINHASRELVENQQRMAIALQELAMKMNQVAKDFPKFSWVATLIASRITLHTQHLQNIANTAKRGKVAVDSMAFLLGLPHLSYSELEETRFHAIGRISANTIFFNFSVNIRSPDTNAYNVYGFPHWNNISETPEFVEYQGARLLIYNETSNCIKAIEEPLGPLILESCEELDGEDPSLSDWRPIRQTHDIYQYENDSYVQKFEDYNYIYCFPGRILLDNKSYRCPLEVFRLPANKAFKTAKQRHNPTRIRLNVTKEHSIDNIHIGHFDDDSDVVNELKLYDRLVEVRKNLSLIENDNFVVSRPRAWTFAISTPLIGALFGVAVYSGVLYTAFQLLSRPFRANAPRPPPYRPEYAQRRHSPAYELRLREASTEPTSSEPFNPNQRIYVELTEPAQQPQA